MKAARPKTRFVCQECGYQGLRWSGQCPECTQWNSLREEVQRDPKALKQRTVSGGIPEVVPIGDIIQTEEFRLQSGIEELNRVLGGGVRLWNELHGHVRTVWASHGHFVR